MENLRVNPVHYSLSFDNSNKHYKPVVKVMDSTENEQIKQIPPEGRVKLAEHIGNLVDTYV